MDTNNHKPWQRHKTDLSRRESLLATKRKWAHKDYFHSLCNKTMMISNKSIHDKTKNHLSKVK